MDMFAYQRRCTLWDYFTAPLFNFPLNTSKTREAFLTSYTGGHGVPIQVIVFWDLHWGPPILGNSHVDLVGELAWRPQKP